MTSYSARLLKVLIITTVVITAIHLILKYISVVIFQEQNGIIFELSNRFDMNDENSVPQWVSQLLFLGIGAGAFLAAYLQTKKAARNLWIIIGALGVLMSLDDVATIHEFLLQVIHITILGEETTATIAKNAWVILLPFVLALAAWLAWRAYRVLPRRTTKLFVIAGAIFLTGAIFVDSLSNAVPERSFLNQGIFEGIEGAMELTGISIALYAIASYLEKYHHKNIRSALRGLKRAHEKE